jgi:hypothetical protein
MWDTAPAGFAIALTDPGAIRDPCPCGGDSRPPALMQPAETRLRLLARGSRARNFHGHRTVHQLLAAGLGRCDQRRIPGPSARQSRRRAARRADISGCPEDRA